MAQYTVVLFDVSTSTEYTEHVDASSEEEATTLALDRIHAFVCEMEGTADPDGRAKIREDLVKQTPQVTLV